MVTIQLLDMVSRKMWVWIKQFQLIMIITTDIEKIPVKLWNDSFFTVNIFPDHRLSFLSGSIIFDKI